MSNIVPVLTIFFLGAITVVGDYFIKLAGAGPKYMDYPKFIIGTILYALTALGWFYIMKHIKLSTISVLFAVSSIVFLTFLGVVVFKERLSPYEILGIILGLLSVVLLVRFG